MKERPGMMLYFENRACIDALSDAEAGKLIKGLLRYACDGTVPQFDGVLRLVWLMFQPKLDYDAARYDHLCRQKMYAVYCREQEKSNQIKLTFTDWLKYTFASNDTERYPTATPTPKSKASSSSEGKSTATAEATKPDAHRQYTPEEKELMELQRAKLATRTV